MPEQPLPSYVIRSVKCGSGEFEQVISLHAPNRRTLGFFPRGAFEDYAKKGGIYAAIDDLGRVLGYIAVRVSDGWTHIAHLCVDESYRNASIAKALVDQIIHNASRHQHLGVRLKCRRDYGATQFWPKVGFSPRAHQTGRGADRRELTVWVRRNAEVPDLFSLSGADDPERRCAVLDANTFFDLDHEDDDLNDLSESARESLQLCAGWIQDAVEFCVVDEIYCEIERRNCAIEVKNQRERVSGFRELHYDSSEADCYYAALQRIMGWCRPKVQQRSDMKQIAKSAAASAAFFVTRDEELLRAAPRIFEELSIQVLRPSALLTSVDEEGRGDLYSPSRLAGTNASIRVPVDREVHEVLDAFLGRDPQEPLNLFRSKVRRVLAEAAGRDDRVFQLMSDGVGNPVVLVAYSLLSSGEVCIEILRGAMHRLGPTAIRHTLLQIIQRAANSGRRKISFEDQQCSRLIASALKELHFSHQDGKWVRVLLPDILDVEGLENSLPVSFPISERSVSNIISIEDRFWPLKVRGANVSGVVLTINEHWAAKLFDSELAMEELFFVDPHRVLNRENVFYRHKDGWPRSDPKRILWYVSGTKSFRAASRLLSVDRGPAFKLFRNYERLGVYQWDDLMRSAKGNPHGEVMAIHFTDTELFDCPVSLDFAKSVGVGKMVAGPQPITETQFLEIYKVGNSRFFKT